MGYNGERDLREQYYRHDLLAAQIEIAKKTESYAKTGDASRAARAVRDALNKELEKVNGRIEALEGSGDSYFERSADQVLYGNYSDDVTLLGTAGQIGLGLTGLDFAGDIRDLTYDITHWDGSLKHAGQTLLDVVGLIPGIGALKNADEVAALLKQALKAAPALTDGAKYALKNVDVIAAGITSLFKNSDDLASVGKAAGKTAEDLAREYAETARLMKNADKADEAASAVAGAGKPAASEASDALGKAIDAEWYGGKAAKGATEGAGNKIISSVDDINYGQSSLDKAFSKHSADFGAYSDGSNLSKDLFKSDINNLLETGLQKSGAYRATPGTHVYNPSTRQWAFYDANGNFVTAFKLGPDQFKYLIETGVVK